MRESQRNIHVLGIESSCDDTGVAIVRQDGKILSNCVNSQLKKHLAFGGIMPMIAKDDHMEHIDQLANEAFQKSGLKSVSRDIDAIAVTNRPGLSTSLQVGLNYARTLAKKYSKPLIPIHHMQAHALMPLLQNRTIKFPFITLLISGGHCLLAICERYNDFKLLGNSHDDAPGDLLDKVARRLRLKNLGYPFDSISGGAAIELLSRRDGVDRFKYFNDEKSIPMLSQTNCDFSFSGYRGTFERLVPTIDQLWQDGKREDLLNEVGHVCGSLQRAILIQLFKKLQRAFSYYRMHWRYKNADAFNKSGSTANHIGFSIRNCCDDDFDGLDVVVSGGVAANKYIIEGLKDACSKDLDSDIRVFAPTKDLCSDNGLMIAWNGLLKYMSQSHNQTDHFYQDQISKDVIHDHNEMDLVEVIPDCKIGIDMRQAVRLADLRVSRLKNPELKLRPLGS